MDTAPLWPQGGYTGEFVEPNIPDSLFMIQYNGDVDNVDGPFDGSTFLTDPDTNIAYSRNGDGHPVFIRCTDQVGSHLNCIDGDGSTYAIDITPVSDTDE